MKVIDLRSDTVTQPTPAMREAMYRAEVGDDVFGEDPTVNRMEEMSAERLGKEAALFVASGTMGNLVALLAHCGRGDEAIVGDRSHTFLFEQGGMAALGGITPRPLPNRPDGTLDLTDIERAIRADDDHFPRSRLICLENTHNYCNGTPLTAAYTAQVARLARAHGLRLHLDGARIFNAAAALQVEVRELVRDVDSVMFCLSKGLGAPVGSLLCADGDFIAQARRARKVVGGGMRQAGILAAAGIVALEQMTDRLVDDHRRARRLAEGLALLPGVQVAPLSSNILYFSLSAESSRTPEQVVEGLERRGIRLLGRENGRFRIVLHCWISDEDVERVLAALQQVL
ncbi:MAG: low-specificity L-threonine aldolase [Anaerolineae bacterium]|nr:low-specificity L-threonine aldolase [Anaerolineae bacterium]